MGESNDGFLWCEISIAGGVGEMVGVLPLSQNQALYIGIFPPP